MYKRFLCSLFFVGIFAVLTASDAARNPFEFAPPVMPHEQIEKKEIVTTEPIEVKDNLQLVPEKNSNGSWQIIKQSEQGAVVRSADGSLRKIKLPE